MSDIATLQPAEAGMPLSANQLKARLAVIQSVMRDVMTDPVDFGTIPGTDKPTLYKPGAEKLCVTFRLAPADPLIEAVPDLTGDIRYRVRVPIHTADGALVAVGVGECSTGEEKYRWRRPVHPNEFAAAPEDMKRQKWTRDGDQWDQVRVNPADIANTVLKMAHKRAYVHAVIMATAAGAIFTQDIEDLPDGVEQGDAPAKPRVQPPQRKSNGTAPMTNSVVRVKVVGFERERNGAKQNGDTWTKYGIKANDGKTYGTFSKDDYAKAKTAEETDAEIEIAFTEGKYGRDAKTIALITREAGAEG